MPELTCPDGHVSADPDWCDTCGASMHAPSSAAAGSAGAPSAGPSGFGASAGSPAAPVGGAPAVAPVACPHCGSMNGADNLFCESCGYDFTTGQVPHGEPAPAGPAVPPGEGNPGSTWVVVVEVDPGWFALKGELSDQPCPPPSTSTVTISQHVSLIGRSSQSKGIRPEVALDSDTSVSRRHAQLVIEGATLSVVDLSSTNGTYVFAAGEELDADKAALSPGVATVLTDGDRIQLGAWSRLTIRAT